MMKKVILFFANGTEEIEALTPFDMLKRCGADVILCGVGKSKTLLGSHGIKVECDINENDLDQNIDFDMIILPGGGLGSQNLRDSKIVDHFIDRALKENKYIGAICASPSVVLGSKNILVSKKATCYPGFEEGMTGAFVTNEDVVRDGYIITGKGCGVSFEFSFELVSCLYGNEIKEELKRKIVWSN